MGDDRAKVSRKSEREMVVTRAFDAPARLVFAAWTTPEVFRRWWAPKSFGMDILSCVMDVRVGGGYRLEIKHPAAEGAMAFFGSYLEVVPDRRLVWTNEESPDGAVSSLSLEEQGGRTLLTFSERYRSKEALDQSYDTMEGCMPEQLGQLEEVLVGIAS